MSELPQVRPPRCVNMSGKSLMIYGEAFESDPDYQAGLSPMWCVQTGRGLGPDDGEVCLDACSDSKRECYKEY